jgi:hypothetical protein
MSAMSTATISLQGTVMGRGASTLVKVSHRAGNPIKAGHFFLRGLSRGRLAGRVLMSVQMMPPSVVMTAAQMEGSIAGIKVSACEVMSKAGA